MASKLFLKWWSILLPTKTYNTQHKNMKNLSTPWQSWSGSKKNWKYQWIQTLRRFPLHVKFFLSLGSCRTVGHWGEFDFFYVYDVSYHLNWWIICTPYHDFIWFWSWYSLEFVQLMQKWDSTEIHGMILSPYRKKNPCVFFPIYIVWIWTMEDALHSTIITYWSHPGSTSHFVDIQVFIREGDVGNAGIGIHYLKSCWSPVVGTRYPWDGVDGVLCPLWKGVFAASPQCHKFRIQPCKQKWM